MTNDPFDLGGDIDYLMQESDKAEQYARLVEILGYCSEVLSDDDFELLCYGCGVSSDDVLIYGSDEE